MARGVNSSARVLFGKFARIILVAMAVLMSLNSLGIDLTAFAVLSGALAVGLGFGLQKIFSNLVSGVILLLDMGKRDSAVTPGDRG
jgi:small-conductance mechanosensitive channel